MIIQLGEAKHYIFITCAALVLYTTPIDIQYWHQGSWLGAQKFIIYNAFMATVVWSSFYFRGLTNRFIILSFVAVMILEFVSYYYLLYTLQPYSVYLKIWVGTFATSFAYLWFRFYPIIGVKLVTKTNLSDKIKRPFVRLLRPTNFYFVCRNVSLYFLIIELLMSLYLLCYCLIMGIQHNGSVSKTEISHGHISWNIWHEIPSSILTFFFMVLLIRTVMKDWKNKDAPPEIPISS